SRGSGRPWRVHAPPRRPLWHACAPAPSAGARCGRFATLAVARRRAPGQRLCYEGGVDREPGGAPSGAGPAHLVAIAWSRRWVVVYAALATWLLAHVGGYYHPRTGFTSLIAFGDVFATGRLPVLDQLGVHTARHSDGY